MTGGCSVPAGIGPDRLCVAIKRAAFCSVAAGDFEAGLLVGCEGGWCILRVLTGAALQTGLYACDQATIVPVSACPFHGACPALGLHASTAAAP